MNNFIKILETTKTIMIIFLIGVAFFTYKNYENYRNQFHVASLEKEMLEKQLKSIVKIKDNQIISLKRDKDKVKTEIIYLPPEGNIKITLDDNDKQNIFINNKGWTFRPNIGLTAGNNFYPTLGARVLYWNRFGAGIGLTNTGAHLYIDRRIDDYIGFLRNSSAGIFINTNELGLRISSFL